MEGCFPHLRLKLPSYFISRKSLSIGSSSLCESLTWNEDEDLKLYEFLDLDGPGEDIDVDIDVGCSSTSSLLVA